MTIIIGTSELRAKLEELRTEHRDLDEAIQSMSQTSPFNQLQIQRMKKRKLVLKDQITKLESQLLPDIIAATDVPVSSRARSRRAINLLLLVRP